MKRGTVIGGIAVAAAIALAIAAYASPYRAVNALREAAEAGDRDRLATYVDFPALRESLKAELNATVIAPMLGKAEDQPFAGFGTVLAGALLGPMVDAMVTPEGVAEMVRRGRIRRAPGSTTPVPPVTNANPAPVTESAPPAQSPDSPTVSTTRSPPVVETSASRPQPEMGYAGLNRFVVTFPLASSTDNKGTFGLVFFREGLFGWKLSEVRLPRSP